MKTMKMAFLPCLIGSLIMSVLTSCSTTDLYYQPLTQRPSIPWKHSSSSWGGYIESQKNNTITIRYEAYNQPTAEVALYFTELRAAERALIDGKRHFYLVQPPTLNSTPEQSYFPPYTIAGYFETEHYQVYDRCCETGKKINKRWVCREIWHPPVHVPEEFVTNYIHKASMTIAYWGRATQRRDAAAIANAALADSANLGVPKLDERAMATLNHSQIALNDVR